ncbi:MAG: hypothetical protein ACJLTB_02530 [Algoriphagus aquaeductus]|uniref:hypothetical protein n=1 Tax=Algoriphagus aquaeductus TaxID=475299 RepID=UPI00387A7206
MKKSAFPLVVLLLASSLVQAQIRTRTTKPVTTQEITKTNTLSPSGTTTSTSSVTQPLTSTQPDSFFAPYYHQGNWAKRTYEINPIHRNFAFFALDYDGNGIKDIAYRDFYLDDLLGWFFGSPDGFGLEYKSGHDWTKYSSIGIRFHGFIAKHTNGTIFCPIMP